MTDTGGGGRTGAGRVGRDVITVLAGIADLGLETAESLLGRARGLLGRSDLPDLAVDVRDDLRARGDVVLGRFTPAAEPHLEALARRANAARATAGDAAGDARGES
ncbi:MAG: polyprenyl synthetase [Catenulispora sp.]